MSVQPPSHSSNSNSSSSNHRTGGVADYFAILGVGDALVLKSTQKDQQRYEDEAPPPVSDQSNDNDDGGTGAGAGADAGAGAGAGADASANDGDDAEKHVPAGGGDGGDKYGSEEECAWVERFYREIVEVAVVTSVEGEEVSAKWRQGQPQPRQNDDVSSGSAILGHSASQSSSQSSIVRPIATSATTASATAEEDGALGTISPAMSDATSVDSFTDVHGSEEKRYGVRMSPTENTTKQSSDGVFEIVRQTAAAVAPIMAVRSGMVTASEQSRDADLDPMTGLRSVVLSSTANVGSRAGPGADPENDVQGGMGTSSSGAAGDPSMSKKMLTGFGRKVGDKLRTQLNPILGSSSQEWLHGAVSTATSPRIRGGGGRKIDDRGSVSRSSRRRTYHVAFRRRGADENDRPAVADVAVRFARVHRSTVIEGDGASTRSYDGDGQGRGALRVADSTGTSITKMAAAGANRSTDIRGESIESAAQSNTPHLTRKHFFPDTAEEGRKECGDDDVSNDLVGFRTPRVQLADLLELPIGYDEWAIPDQYKYLRFPIPGNGDVDMSSTSAGRPTSPEMRLRRTVLFSHSPSALEGSVSPSEASGAGVEALLRASSPSPSMSSSQGPNSPSCGDRYSAAQVPHDRYGRTSSESTLSTSSRSNMLAPHLISPGSLPMPSESEASYDYIPILAVRRQRVGDEERYREDPAAVNITLSSLDRAGRPKMYGLGEGSDDDYEDDEEDDAGVAVSVLRKTGWKASADVTLSSRRLEQERSRNQDRQAYSSSPNDFLGMPVVLLRHNSPQGFADAPFATSVVDRFPQKDYKGLPLPEEELPMFCYPTGCRLHRAKFQDAPLAQCYGFVVKNERGDSIHVSCVSFMEPLTKAKTGQLDSLSVKRSRTSIAHRRFCERRRELVRNTGQIGADDLQSGDVGSYSRVEGAAAELFGSESSNFLLTGFDDQTTFENKTICLVSRYPFWTAFRHFLSHLHVMSGSSSDLPLERFVSHLLLTVPVPSPGGQSVIVPLPSLNGPMVLSMPPPKDLPLLDLPFRRLFACLDVPSVVTVVLGFLALERKVIIMSTHPSLVLDACELLRSLLFPFELCAPYVPRLTQPFMSCLEFPGAIFVGIHDDECEDGLAASVRRNMPEDSVIIDLDSGDIDCSSDRYEVLKQCWNIIPSEPRTILVQEIETLCRDAGLVPGQEPIDSQIDSAFDASVPTTTTTTLVEDFDGRGHRAKDPLDDRAVQDSFLRFFCSILGGYERYLVVPDVDFVISGNEWFDAQGFLASASQDYAPYLGSLVSTQLFQSFIQRRTEASDLHCVLFDDCLAEFHASTVPYGRLGGDVETVTSVDGEDPQVLFSLLVDQCATESLPEMTDTSVSDVVSMDGNRTAVLSIDGSDAETQISTSVIHISASHSIDASGFSSSGDYITVPSRQNLNEHQRFVYCIDGNPCFPNKLARVLFSPPEPERLSAIVAKVDAPVLTRSDRELDESNRRRKLAISHRGLHNQRRCLWQLPKLMGSHVLGTWLMCIPPLISQLGLSSEIQARYLLRALGTMRIMRSRQRIIPDEAAYRCLMIACGRAASDRRVELAKLFGLLRSDGIFPSAVTLGQYTRAIAEGFSKRSSGMPDDKVTESVARQSLVADGETVPDFSGVDALTILNVLDTNLSFLEESGKKWRHRHSREGNQENAAEEVKIAGVSGEKTPSSSPPKRPHRSKSHHKAWMPVTCSTSFAPVASTQTVDDLKKDDFEFVALWSRTTVCESCSYIPLDEEVMSGWDTIGNESDDSSCAVACPRCGSLVTPLIGYRAMTVDEALSSADECHGHADVSVDASADKTRSPSSVEQSVKTSYTEGSGIEASLPQASRADENFFADYLDLPPQLRPSPGSNVAKDGKSNLVTYLSPSSMRLLLEQYVEEHGEDVLERDTLRKLDPRLYYNLWWYCARFSLPLPLMIASPKSSGDGPTPIGAMHLSAFVAWDRTVAETGCEAGARALLSLLKPVSGPTQQRGSNQSSAANNLNSKLPVSSSVLAADFPLLSQFNLQSYASSDWDHKDLSKILVTLVEACDKKDFLPVIECFLQCNEKREGAISRSQTDVSGSEILGSEAGTSISGANQSASSSGATIDLDCYRTLLYLARYQCTSAFHTFFPATAKPCKGYHFWCAQGTPLAVFDRFFRDAVNRLRTRGGNFAPIQDTRTSDIAIGFRCVFGHVI